MKQLWTLHFIRYQPKTRAEQATYGITRHLTNQSRGEEGGMPQTQPMVWDRISRAQEQVGCDQMSIVILKKNLDAKGSDSVIEVLLDESQLRVLGFTDI
jgi:hypothetical protein